MRRKLMIVVASVVALVYLIYRGYFTLNLESNYAIFASLLLYIAECYGAFQLFLFFFEVWETQEPEPLPPLENRTVDVLIPTFNEDVDLLRGTIAACKAMDYPNKTYVLDDGNRDEVKQLAEEMGVYYIRREKNVHAKAGNINHALDQTDGEFVVVLDADHVPQRNFISRTLGYFQDEQLAFVQTPHSFYNHESFMSKLSFRRDLYWEEGELFYNVIQPGKNRWNAHVFCGSAAIFRRKALEDVGYIAVETITEDMHTGMRMHAKGWNSLFVNERLISGQAAPELTTYHSQRLRWGTGNLSILWHDNPLFMRGLTLPQRINYLASMLGWTNAGVRLALYLTPVLMLFSGVAPVRDFTWQLGVITAAYLAMTWAAVKYVSNGYGWLLSIERAAMANFFTNLRSVWRALTNFGRRMQFVVTSKRGRQTRSILPYVWPQLLIATLGIVGIIWASLSIYFGVSYNYLGLVIGGLLSLFYAHLAFQVIRRSVKRADLRRWTRWPCQLFSAFSTAGESRDVRSFGSVFDLSEQGCGLIAYRQLSKGQQLTLRLESPAQRIDDLQGVVRSATKVVHADATAYRVGIEFVDTTPEKLEALWSCGLDYGVPKQYKEFDKAIRFSVWFARLRRRWAERSGFKQYHLPIELVGSHSEKNGGIGALTEAISETSTVLLLGKKNDIGQQFEFSMGSPFGHAAGQAEVAEVSEESVGALTLFRHELKLRRFDGMSRTFYNDAVHASGTLARNGLRPQTRQTRPPLGRAVAATLAPILLVGAIAVAYFAYRHADEIFLSRVAQGMQLDRDGQARFDRLVAASEANDGLSISQRRLLASAAAKMGRTDEAVRIGRGLPGWELSEVDQQMDRAIALENEEKFAEAAAAYAAALAALTDDSLTGWTRPKILLAAARSSVRAEDLDAATGHFGAYFELFPGTRDERIEYAGILSTAGNTDEALAQLEKVEPDIESRYLEGAIHATAGNFEDALGSYQEILEEDPSQSRARELLADAAVCLGNYPLALENYRQVLDEDLDDERRDEIRVKHAYALVWSKYYPPALDEFTQLLSGNPGRVELWSGFLDAAAGVEDELTVEQDAIFRIIDIEKIDDDRDPADRIAQVAALYIRAGELNEAIRLLEEALSKNPTSRVLLFQLANAFHNDRQYARADLYYQRLLDLHSAESSVGDESASTL